MAKSIGPALRVDVVGPAAAMLGEEATFKVHLLNQGEAEARGITVRIGVPDSARVVGSEAGAGDARVQTDSVPTQVVWTLDRLQAQAASGLTLRLVPMASRPIELSRRLVGPALDFDRSNRSQTVPVGNDARRSQ